MHVLEDGTYLVECAVVLLLDATLILGDQPRALFEVLLILHIPEVSLVHLAGHLLEVLKDTHLVLLAVLAQEGLKVVLVVNQPVMGCVLRVNGGRVTPQENLAGVKLLEHLIVLLQFLGELLESLGFEDFEVRKVDCRGHHVLRVESLIATLIRYVEGGPNTRGICIGETHSIRRLLGAKGRQRAHSL